MGMVWEGDIRPPVSLADVDASGVFVFAKRLSVPTDGASAIP
jgi:hypothetical protein